MLKLFLKKALLLLTDDQGADLIEYGLLALIVAVVGVALFPSIGAKLSGAFNTWGTKVYDAWEPPNPQ